MDSLDGYTEAIGPGQTAPLDHLVHTTTLPTVTIGGVPATVSFSGLAPGEMGLYQVNVTVPLSVNPGQQNITISIGGQSASAAITIQATSGN